MNFTRSLDGHLRASVRVVFRMDASAAAEALALEAMGANPDAAMHVVLGASRADIARALRGRLALQGPPIQWTEYDADLEPWRSLLAAAGERVAELWPETQKTAA